MSMEFLVTVIIALVILGTGITLLYSFITSAEETKANLDTRTNEEMERLLVDEGKQVALPLHTANVPAGKTHVFGVGILNTGNLGGNNFKIGLGLAKYIDKVGNSKKADEMNPQEKKEAESWVLYNDELIPILENEHEKEPLLIKIPKTAPKGQYIFNVKVYLVKDDGTEEQYGNTQNFYVTVK